MMLKMILWKEYREQRGVWLVLAAVTAAAIFGVAYGMGIEGKQGQGPREMLSIAVLILAWTYGAVCGAMLLAGESEGGTQSFIDALPAGRLSVWWCKFV